MNRPKQHQSGISRWLIIGVSIVFSLIILWHQQPSNGDALVYINTAKAYAHEGLRAALASYPWPWFSLLLYYSSQWLHLSYVMAGTVLNTLFITGIVLCFVRLSKALSGHLSAHSYYPLTAAIVILSFPYLNHFRDDILRDAGYYFFALSSVYYFLQYLRHADWRNALLWNVTVLLAALFRVEGVIFAVLMPLGVLCKAQSSVLLRIYNSLKLYIMPAIVSLLALLIFAVQFPHLSLLHDTRIAELQSQFSQGLVASMTSIITAADQLKIHVLGPYGQHDALTIMVFGILGIVLSNIYTTLGFFNTIFAVYGWRLRLLLSDESNKIAFYGYLSVNALICLAATSQLLFLSARYSFFGVLLLLLIASTSMTHVFLHWRTTRTYKLLAVAAIGAIIYNLVASLGHFGTSKTYIIQAAQWLNQHTPSASAIYTNDTQLAIYVQQDVHVERGEPAAFIAALKRNHVDYVAINSKANDIALTALLEQSMSVKKIADFGHGDGAQLTIYQKISE